MTASPLFRGEDVYAAWLALNPATSAYEWPLDGMGFIDSLNTAAFDRALKRAARR